MTRGGLTSWEASLKERYKGNPKSNPYEMVIDNFSLEGLSLKSSALLIGVAEKYQQRRGITVSELTKEAD